MEILDHYKVKANTHTGTRIGFCERGCGTRRAAEVRR